ncbi:MAG: hypothetical protein Q9182_002440 [Xanthomendoza sp. 2 TL-2023]
MDNSNSNINSGNSGINGQPPQTPAGTNQPASPAPQGNRGRGRRGRGGRNDDEERRRRPRHPNNSGRPLNRGRVAQQQQQPQQQQQQMASTWPRGPPLGLAMTCMKCGAPMGLVVPWQPPASNTLSVKTKKRRNVIKKAGRVEGALQKLLPALERDREVLRLREELAKAKQEHKELVLKRKALVKREDELDPDAGDQRSIDRLAGTGEYQPLFVKAEEHEATLAAQLAHIEWAEKPQPLPPNDNTQAMQFEWALGAQAQLPGHGVSKIQEMDDNGEPLPPNDNAEPLQLEDLVRGEHQLPGPPEPDVNPPQ